MIYFSDNITTIELEENVKKFTDHSSNPGCILLSRDEESPHAFGVAQFDDDGNIIDIIEKPENPLQMLPSVEFISLTNNFGL